MKTLISAVTLLAVSTAQANTIYVDANCPGGDGSIGNPYCSIQTAIDNAVDTDEIIVAPGTYFETIDFLGKVIWLHSSDGPDVTVIDAQQAGTVVTCDSGEEADTTLDGLTITGGFGHGGGMVIDGSNPTVRNCRFIGNTGDPSGGAVFARNFSSVSFTGCAFIENPLLDPLSPGGGIHAQNYIELTVTGCTFIGNQGFVGGAIRSGPFSLLTLTDCLFADNGSGDNAAGVAAYDGIVTVERCVFSGHDGVDALEVGFGTLTVLDSVFCGNGGNGFVSAAIIESNDTSLIANCLFVSNSGSSLRGGGLFTGTTGAEIVNCTFVRNMPAGITADITSALVSNCIFWDNNPVQLTGDPVGTPSNASVFYSDVQGGYSGPGSNNIDADPLFVGGPNGTWTGLAVYDPSTGLTTFTDASALYVPGTFVGAFLTPITLVNDASFIVGNTATTITVPGDETQFGVPGIEYAVYGYTLLHDSPCIDAGDNTAVPEDITADLVGNPRFIEIPETPDTGNGTLPIVDMGAYESLGDGCLAVTAQEIVCHADGTTFTVNVEGLNACTGGTTQVTFTASGGAVGEELCFTALVNDGGFCCTTEICVTIPDCTPAALPSDLDGDGIVGMVDFLALIGVWGTCSDCGTPQACPADLDGDCSVGILDLLILLGNWD